MRLWSRSYASGSRRARRRRRRSAGQASQARQAHRARAHRTAGRSRLAISSSSRRWPPTACTTTMRRRPGSSPASACVEGQHCVDRRQRRDRQGRHVLPDDGQEASARARDRRAESICRASTSSTRAARSCRCKPTSFPIAITSAASSTIRRACRASASRRSPR